MCGPDSLSHVSWNQASTEHVYSCSFMPHVGTWEEIPSPVQDAWAEQKTRSLGLELQRLLAHVLQLYSPISDEQSLCFYFCMLYSFIFFSIFL